MKIFDVSMPIFEGMPVYKNKPEKQPNFETTADFPVNGVHETRIHLDAHTGTHVDAPLHMVKDGAAIEKLALQDVVRPCKVLDLTHVSARVTVADLAEQDIQAGDFLLLKTKNSFRSLAAGFDPEFVFISEDAARYLATQRIAGIGVDGLGVERGQPGHPTHKALFQCGAVILEGLALADVAAGTYLLIAAPLKIVGADAAPARVLLLQDL